MAYRCEIRGDRNEWIAVDRRVKPTIRERSRLSYTIKIWLCRNYRIIQNLVNMTFFIESIKDKKIVFMIYYHQFCSHPLKMWCLETMLWKYWYFFLLFQKKYKNQIVVSWIKFSLFNRFWLILGAIWSGRSRSHKQLRSL